MRRVSLILALVIAISPALAARAEAGPSIVIDADTGRVLHAEDATRPWYPASLTKLMTTYVALQAVKAGRVGLDTPMVYSARAQLERPSKMGFPVGTIITLDNALKLLMVKSANDVAVTIAEGVSGSVEAFAAEMNQTALRLGMTTSRFVNPNGWHDAGQVSSARDMAILARALLRDYPQKHDIYNLPALKLGNTVIRGHNRLLGRFAGADGMKTGFTCPSGFNLVASARRGDQRLIAVVLGDHTAKRRNERAAELLDANFGSRSFWRMGQSVESLPPAGGVAPNLRAEVCEKKKAPVGEVADGAPIVNAAQKPVAAGVASFAEERKPLLADTPMPFTPHAIFLGPNPSNPNALPAAPGPALVNAANVPANLVPDDPSPSKAVVVPMPVPRPADLAGR